MEEQLHRPHGHQYDDPGTHLHEEDERGGETKSAMKKVKGKVDKLTDTIMHGHGHGHGHNGGEVHKDEAQTMNDSSLVKSGLVEPTIMGTPVLVEDLYTTHSDILDPPVRTFAQWEEEEKHGDPPPLSTGYGNIGSHMTDQARVGHYDYGRDENKKQLQGDMGKYTSIEDDRRTSNYPTINYEDRVGQVTDRTNTVDQPLRSYPQRGEERCDTAPQMSVGVYGTHPADLSQAGHHIYSGDENKGQFRGGMGKLSGMEEDPNAPNSTTPANYQSKVTDPTNTGGKEAGITDVLRSLDKMKVYDEPANKSLKSDQNEPTEYTGSHNQFAPESVNNPPLDTIADDPSNPNSSYKQRISSATSAITDKASALKDSIVSKLSSPDENRNMPTTEAHKTNTKSSPTVYAHMVAETLSGTLGPVYEKVADAGSSVMLKMQGSGHDYDSTDDAVPESRGVTVKEYLVNTFKPGEDDKILSDAITHAFHPEKANEPPLETTSTTTAYVILDEGERRLQDSGN